MNIERIKSVKLLKTLKGTDDNGKPIYWLAGETFYPDKKPLPQSILRELSVKRMGGSILEVVFKPESPPPIVEPEKIEPEKVEPEKELSPVEVPEPNPDITPDDIEEEKPKEIPEKKIPVRRKKK